MKQTKIKKLKSLHPCNEAMEWLKEKPSIKVAWETCERGDWMLWLLGNLSGEVGSKSRKQLVWTACQCARLSLKYVTEGEKRPLITIETAEKYTKGLATLQEVRAAYADAYANAVYISAAAAYAAATAAYAADATADGTYTAAAATYAADATADAAAKNKILKQCANIVRENYHKVPKLK